ncbi:MAG: T9SS type A sorting domain-containing protein, partial [Saprospiraceae bacterium]
DNCSGTTVAQSPLAGTKIALAHNATTSITVTATDAAGLTDVESVVLTAKDITAPVLTAAANQNVNLDGNCQITVPDVTGTATDNCSGTTITQNPLAGTLVSAAHNGTVNVIVTATDVAGLTDVETVVLTAKDVTAPVLTAASNQDVNLDGMCEITVPDVTGSATDNCSGTTIVQSPLAGTKIALVHNATTNISVTATDAAGLTDVEIVVLTAKDVTAPGISAGTIAAVYSSVLAAETAAIAATTASDNCGTVTKTAATVGLCAATITVTATDAAGNTSSVIYSTQIDIPGPPPTAVAGGSETICDNGAAVVMGASATNGTILWTHNGAGALTDATTIAPTYTPGPADAGTTVTLTMTVTGTSGCSSPTVSATYSVVVRAHVSAVISGGATVCANEPLPTVSIAFTGTGPWTFRYDVDGNPTLITGSMANPFVITSPVEGNYTLLAVEDANCEGDVSGSANVTVLADIPTVNAGADVTLNCSNNRAFLEATGTGISYAWNNGVIMNGSFVRPVQTTTYTVTATGSNGCKNTDQITVFTNEVVITCPSDQTMNTNSDLYNNYNCSTTVLPSSGLNPTLTDLCDISLLRYALSGASTGNGNGTISGLSLNSGVTTVTYSALVSPVKSCSFNVTVVDLEAPKVVLSSTQATMIVDACDFPPSIPGSTPTPQDNCDASPSLTVVSDVTATVSGCATKSATLKYTKLLTRTWRATDASGNSATAIQRIYLRDMAPPTAICRNFSVTIGNTNQVLSAALFNNGSFDACSNTLSYAVCNASTNANCTNFASSITVSRSMIPANQSQVIIPVRLRVTDGCGNVSFCTSNLTLIKATTLTNPGTSNTVAGDTKAADSKPVVPSDVMTDHGAMKCFPNPFTDDLNINFNLTNDVENVVLKLYDSTGKLVATLNQGISLAGYYTARWNLSDLDGGMYNVCLEINNQCKKTQRVILLK